MYIIQDSKIKMENLQANLYPCAHCGQTGVCASGDNGQSCVVCIKMNDLKVKAGISGIPCSICGGIGLAEPKTERINKRMGSILGLTVVMGLIILVFVTLVGHSQHLPQILTFSSTLLSFIFGYYFSRQKS